MARTSFRLRQPDDGGRLRSHDNADTGSDDSDGLRADGLQLAPEEAVTAPFFNATSSCYGEVDLSWYLPLSVPTTATPEPVSSVVVYSPFGPPETIGSGVVVYEGSDTFQVTHHGVPGGVFGYYSLFVHYMDNTLRDGYFEKVAEVSEMVPRNYGSTVSMWERIPAFYRDLDGLDGDDMVDVHCMGFDNYGEPVGPLLKFLSIFGFEMDRSRSIMEHISRSKNPEFADTESLSALATEMGTVIDLDDLGAARLRNLLFDIGVFRRIKGTQEGTRFFVRSLSGSTAVIDTAARTISVYSQRVNYIIDPNNTKSVTDIETTRDADDDEADNPDTYEIGDTPPTSTGGTVYHLDSPVEVDAGDIVSFSVHSGVGTNTIKWARISDSTTDEVLAFQDTPSSREGIPYFDVVAPILAEVNIEFMVDDSATFGNSQYLLEKNSVGHYFDGDLVRGGWLVGSTSISDYRWEGGAANADNARSLYNEDYERTRQVMDSLFDDVLPIDVASEFTISYNHVPGNTPPVPPPPTTVWESNFTQADGTWTDSDWTLVGTWEIVSNALVQDSYNSTMRFTGTGLGDSQYIEFVNGDSGDTPGSIYTADVVLNATDDTGSTGYRFAGLRDQGVGAITVERDGVYLANLGTITSSWGDTIKVENDGGVLTVYVNGVSQATTTDGTPLTGGSPCLRFSGEDTKPTIDDLVVDNV